MASHDTTAGSAGAGSLGANSHLGRLNDLDEFKVADGYPDIRGWEVRTGDGHKLGKVGDLVVDTQAVGLPGEHPEDGWLGRELAVGDEVVLAVDGGTSITDGN